MHRVSESLGTATETRAMRNYAGHRLSPWLGHLMVSRSETARALLTQGEIMQLPDTDEIVMLAGSHPIRAKKARYFTDQRLSERVRPPPSLVRIDDSENTGVWDDHIDASGENSCIEKIDNRPSSDDAGLRREPEIPEQEEVPAPNMSVANEFDFEDRRDDDRAARNRQIAGRMRANARQAALDPGDGIEL